MIYNNEQVKKFLPHREPFLFIDTVEKVFVDKGKALPSDRLPTPDDLIELGATVCCRFNLRENLDILKGHFPGQPILPGVVQVEMMAQSSAFNYAQTMADPLNAKIEVALLTIKESKFRKPITPPADLYIFSKCIKRRGNMYNYEGWIEVGGVCHSQAFFMATIGH